MTMGSRSLLVTLVITVVIPSIWAGAIAGAQTQKIRRESRESGKYWPNSVGISDQQLRQLLAHSLADSYSTSGASHIRGGDGDAGYIYDSRDQVDDTGTNEEEGERVIGSEVTSRDSNPGTSKRNGFFYGKRNGFFYGKRSASTPGNANEVTQCTPCGPQNNGQCVMFGTCCSYELGGCFFLTEEALPCVTSKSSSLCELSGLPCGDEGYGRCVADSVCCLPQEGSCHINAECGGKMTFQ
ncbi:uncharacterized protein [Asterias amurensis]|uniref:uncharacterized protein n=1 Tax=Asterias amurensis TaxID=7602 RepID=UPI003AB71B2B